MRIDILTLFPNMFTSFLNESIIKRAIEKKIVTVNIIDFREYSTLNNKQVDDTPYGGGAGMVLRCEPIFACIEDIKTEDSIIIMLTPSGKPYSQKKAKELKEVKHLILLCGHYEGFDERIKSIVDEEISIGDYVLTGGELPAMVVADSVIRLLDGVISNESLGAESFEDNLLDYPVYTKPREFKGMKVPEVLLSGDHKKIEAYRKQERNRVTSEKRPDIMK